MFSFFLENKHDIVRAKKSSNFNQQEQVTHYIQLKQCFNIGNRCSLILSGGMVSAEDLPPLPPVPPDYADKKMPAGGWTDAKAIEEGGKISSGEFKTEVNCSSCHEKDGAQDLRDLKLVCRCSHAFWFRRISEGVPKTKIKANKGLLSEEQIWQVTAYENQFSHGGKPADRACY